ncbi:M16 family metallopeptidase [Mangrovibacterium sp.]|uniref:M16 family metallopeptidase n=1 Tax=Mangrovibacterium sp. TaxID=1961364 RepID=UPI003561CF68
MKTVIITLLFLFPSVLLFAQVDRTHAPKPETPQALNLGEMTSFKLNNGLKVFLVNRPGYTKFTMSINIDQPSIQDDNQEPRSVLSAAYYKNYSLNMAEGVADSLTEQLGAQIGATINGGFIKGMKRDIKTLLDLYTEALFNPAFTAEDIQNEADKYAKRITKKQEQPQITELRNIGIILTDSLVHGKIGTEAKKEQSLNYDTLTIADVKAYQHKRVVANNALIVLIGDFSRKEAEALINRSFGNWKTGEPHVAEHNFENTESRLISRKIYVIDNPLAVQSKISFHWNIQDAFPYFEKTSELQMLNEVFGSSQNSYLYRNLREDKGLCYFVGSSIGESAAGGSAHINTSVRNDVTALAVENIILEMLRIRNTTVSDLDFDIAKGSLINEFSRSISGISTIPYISFAMAKDQYNLADTYLQERVQKVYNVTKEDIRQMAQKYVNPFACLILVEGKAEELKGQLEKFGEVHYITKDGKNIEFGK